MSIKRGRERTSTDGFVVFLRLSSRRSALAMEDTVRARTLLDEYAGRGEFFLLSFPFQCRLLVLRRSLVSWDVRIEGRARWSVRSSSFSPALSSSTRQFSLTRKKKKHERKPSKQALRFLTLVLSSPLSLLSSSVFFFPSTKSSPRRHFPLH